MGNQLRHSADYVNKEKIESAEEHIPALSVKSTTDV